MAQQQSTNHRLIFIGTEPQPKLQLAPDRIALRPPSFGASYIAAVWLRPRKAQRIDGVHCELENGVVQVIPVLSCAGAGRCAKGQPSVSVRLRLERLPYPVPATCHGQGYTATGPVVEVLLHSHKWCPQPSNDLFTEVKAFIEGMNVNL